MKFAYLGEHAVRREPAYDIASEFIGDIKEELPFETSFIVEQNGVGRHLTPEINRPGRYDLYDVTGAKEYLHATASGKAILAALTKGRVEEIIDQHGLPEITEHTITDEQELFEELEKVRQREYAINDRENRPGMYTGKAVHRPNGTVLGAISIGTQVSRIKKIEFEQRVPALIQSHVESLEEQLESTL